MSQDRATDSPPSHRLVAIALSMLGGVLPVVVATLHDLGRHSWVFFLGAGLGIVAPMAASALPARVRLLRMLVGLAGLPGLTMMQASNGGIASPYAVLLVMAMVWYGLMAPMAEVRVALGIALSCCFLPMLVVGAPAYPVELAPAVVLAIVLSSVVLSLAASTREASRLTDALRHDATHDRLTGLLNRRGWDQLAASELTAASRRRRPMTVVLLDLDRLKEVNDTFGHDRGDHLLRSTADHLQETFRDEPAVARLGGDEFAVLLDGSPDQAFARLEEMRSVVDPSGGFSAGVALAVRHGSLGDVMRRVDLALYEAKTSGRGRSCLAGGPLQTTR